MKIELGATPAQGALDHLLGRFRGPDVARDVSEAVGHEVVVTHDGKLLFAYAANEAALSAARTAIEGVLQRDGIGASVSVSRWDEDREEWLQTDPPPTAEALAAREAADRDAGAVETRTLVASAGKWVREEFEQTMLAWADRLGIEFKIIEHPHMLSTQVAMTVTGPKRKIDEFVKGLAAEGTSTMRTETAVMLSPL